MLEPEFEELPLSCEKFHVVKPTIVHVVEPQGNVRFHVEFFVNCFSLLILP
ncbi:MAG TPA: hypothetical protein DCL66_09025 [Gammaproteobacteria bacterium]|nr:hypothetical protein [Gammaproteobacteria bacterium]